MFLLNLIAATQIILTATPWYEQRMEGWYYFQEQEEEDLLSPTLADEILDIEKKKLQELLSLAILSPTEENVGNYLRAKEFWIHQSARFADACGEIESPGDSIAKMGEKWFLLVFLRKENETAAKIAQQFSIEHGWSLKGISLDGETIAGIDSIEDRGVAKRMGVQSTPAYYMVDPEGQQFVCLGTGDLTLADLERKISRGNE